MNISTQALATRIEGMSIPEPNSGCWIWLGHIKNNGYGTLAIKVGSKWMTRHSHRISYEVFVGPVPANFDLDHVCRMRSCVNPRHLEPVTRNENLRRSPLMNRQEHKTTCPRGHEYSGVNNRGARHCHTCAAEAQRRHRGRA